MNAVLYATFVLASVVLIVSPGPNVSLLLANAMAYGGRRTLWTLAGMATAQVILLTAVTVGMAAVVEIMSNWFEVIRWVGVAYLLWIGVRMLLTKPEAADAPPPAAKARGALFLQGFVIAGTNPKVLLFYGAFFPQSLDPALPAAPQLALLAVTYLVLAVTIDGGYALLGDRIGRRLRRPSLRLLLDRITGGLVIAAGIGLALARR